MLSLRSALLVALAALCCGSSLVSAQGPPYNFTLTTSSGQVPGALPAFRVFAGATEYITVQHSAPLGVGEGTNIVLTCTTAGPSDVGVTVYPASHCLTSDGSSPVSRMFAVTAGSKNVGDASNTVTCTFALQGINTAVFGVVPALGPIIIRAPQKLTMPASIAGALDSANPMEVYAFADYGTLYDFTFLAGAEEAAVGSVWLTPTCSSLVVVPSPPALDANLNFNFTLQFGVGTSEVGNARCSFSIPVNNNMDDGRFAVPAPVYFKIIRQVKTELVVNTANLKWSATSNTTNMLTVTPTPALTGAEWLSVTMTSCGPWGSGRAAEVQPDWSQCTVRWGSGATSNTAFGLRLPVLNDAGLLASCFFTIDGSKTALQRYTVANSGSVDVIVGNKVQLLAELDLVSQPTGSFNPVLGARVAVRVSLPAGVSVTIGKQLTVSVSCAAPCGSTGVLYALAPTTVSQHLGDWVRNSTGDLTNGPLFQFRASGLRTDVGIVECTWSLSGDDGSHFFIAPAKTVFEVRQRYELSITADSGLASPITSVATVGFEPYSYTTSALNLGATPTITVTVAHMQHNLDIQLSCGMSGVLNMTTSGADASASLTWTSAVLNFWKTGSAAGKFIINPTVDPVRLNGAIVCSWTLSGEAKNVFATPAPLNFYVGSVTQLKATLVPAPYDGVRVWAYPALPLAGATQATFNVTAVDASALVGMAGLSVGLECIDDMQVTTVSGVLIPTGAFGYDGQPLSIQPDVSSNFRMKHPTATVPLKCSFKLPTTFPDPTLMDPRGYLVPADVILSFQPQRTVTVSGTALLNNPLTPSASITAFTTNTIDFTVSSLPTNGEMLSINITCSGFGPEQRYVQWLSGSSALTQTTSWEMPVIGAGDGWTVRCNFQLTSDNYKYAPIDPVSITVGTLRTWTQIPAVVPTVYTGDDTQTITLTPSGCLGVGVIEATCRNAADLDYPFGDITFYDTAGNTLGASLSIDSSFQNGVQFYFTAPYIYNHSSTTCTFKRTWLNDLTMVAFEEIAAITFQLADKAAILIDGMANGHAPNDVVTLSIRPTAAVGASGLTAAVYCYFQTNGGLIILPGPPGMPGGIGMGGGGATLNPMTSTPSQFFWFAGTSQPQTFKIQLPSTPSIYNYYCNANAQSGNDEDNLHFKSYAPVDSQGNPVVYWVGQPWSFSLGTADGAITGIPFLHRTCTDPGNVTLSVRRDGAAPAATLTVYCYGLRTGGLSPVGLYIVTDQNPLIPTSSGAPLSFGTPMVCGVESHTFTVLAGTFEGDIRCDFVSSLPISQLAPTSMKMHAGTFDPNAVTAADTLSKGAIAGIVIGSVVGFALIVLLLLMVLKRGGAPGGGNRNNPKVTQAPPPQQGVALVDMQGSGAVHPAPQLPEQTS